MATIVDALFVTLGYDTAGLRRGTREAEQSLGKLNQRSDAVAANMARGAARAADSYKRIRNEVLALLAVFIGGKSIKEFVTDTVMQTAALSRMSANLDMSAKSLAQWQLANRNAGGTLEGMTAQLQQSQQAVARFKLGEVDSTVQEFFKHMLPDQSAADLATAESFLRARARILERMYEIDPAKAAEIGARLGISSDTYTLIRQGTDAIDQLRGRFETAASAQAALSATSERLRQRFDELRTNLQTSGLRVLDALMPSIEMIVTKFERLGEWVAQHGPQINLWVSSFAKGATELASALGAIAMPEWLGSSSAPDNLSRPASPVDRARMFAEGTAPKFDFWRPIDSAKDMISFYSGGDEWRVNAKNRKETEERQVKLSLLEQKYGLPKGVLDSMWKVESDRGNNMGPSSAGATGHFQFMEPTAKQYGMTQADTYDFDKSSEAAARMMRDLQVRNEGDLRKSLAGYNWGQGNVEKQGMNRMPSETRMYVTRIISRVGAPEVRPTTGVGVPPPGPPPAQGNSHTDNSVTMHNVTINTQATNARELMRDLPTQARVMADQANGGLR